VLSVPDFPGAWDTGAVTDFGVPPAEPVVRWEAELTVAGWITVFVTVAGGAAGLIWAALAPKLSNDALKAGSDVTFRAQSGADAWFLIVTLVAGAICAVVVCALFGQRGPGAAIGLGVGGLLAALVADRIGYVSEHHSTAAALQALGLHPGGHAPGDVVAELDFRVRALGVLTAWSLVAMLVLGVAIAFEASRR
jgi:hypothetical protein